MKKFNHQKELIKCYMLASTLDELAKSGVFDYFCITTTGKSIPTGGSLCLELSKYPPTKPLKCDKVIAHDDGTFTGLYEGKYLRFLPFNHGTPQMYYGELK